MDGKTGNAMMQKRSACVRGEKCLPLTFKARLNCVVHHHPTLTSQEIADRAQIQHARLLAYASESQPGDNIPFKALMSLCAVLDDFEPINAELNIHHRGIVAFDVKPAADALNESIDVSVTAGKLLDEVRTLSKDGSLDASDRAKLRERLRTMRSEIEEVDAALDTPAPAPLRSVR